MVFSYRAVEKYVAISIRVVFFTALWQSTKANIILVALAQTTPYKISESIKLNFTSLNFNIHNTYKPIDLNSFDNNNLEELQKT